MTETERLAHLTQHLSHALRFGHGTASKQKNPGVKRVLEIAKNNPGISNDKLQEILKVDDDQYATLTSKMTEHGLATFEEGAKLTDKGAEVQQKIAVEDKEVADEIFGGLTADEQTQLQELLEKAVANWHKGE